MEELETPTLGESPESEQTAHEAAAPPSYEGGESHADAARAESAADTGEPATEAPSADHACAEVAQQAAGIVQAAEVSVDELLAGPAEPAAPGIEDVQLRAVLEAIVYVAEEPLALAQLAAALQQPQDRIEAILRQLMAEFEKPEHGVAIREVAGGFKMATKAEHHEAVRSFVKSLKPPLKLSLPALETLAVIAYKQPVTAPEIMEIRGVQGAGVLKTLLDRKLIAVAGRKNVIGKPILYKTTKEFMIQFGLKDLTELPSLKEFEEIRRMALSDSEPPPGETAAPPETAATAPQAETTAAPEAGNTAPREEAPAAAPVVVPVEPDPGQSGPAQES